MRKERFNLYENIIAVLFMIGIVLDVINKKLLKNLIPEEIVGYFFWFTLGLFLGYKICKQGMKTKINNLDRP